MSFNPEASSDPAYAPDILRANFRPDFVWGVASSAYQIEGGWNLGGKGPSIWDEFCHSGSNIAYDHSGDTACNHFELYPEDIALMRSLNINSYRFSVSWPRIFPDGNETLNPQGLEYYDNIVNLLLENDITPYITLYHWDLPLALENLGGWQNRETANAFSKFSEFICGHFSDRVRYFITINEPQIISFLGYNTGAHAPGLKLPVEETLNILHNLALAHGMAVSAMRKSAKKPVSIGFSSTGSLCYPYEDSNGHSSPEDILAAENMSFRVTDDNWNFCHTIFCDAACLGKYPDIDGVPFSELYSFVKDGDLEIIHQPIDFLGLNIYNGHCVNAHGFIEREPGFPRTALKWPVTPGVINWGVQFIYKRYKLPIYITENGLACNDKIFLDGKVHDPDRIDFLQRYILELNKAASAGTDIRGYFHWSFTDNFEWNNGYEERFGLVFIDYKTQTRIPKDSALWFSSII